MRESKISSEMFGLKRMKDLEMIRALIKRKVPGPKLIEVMDVRIKEARFIYIKASYNLLNETLVGQQTAGIPPSVSPTFSHMNPLMTPEQSLIHPCQSKGAPSSHS